MILKSKCFAQAGCKNGVLEQEPDEDAEEEIDESTKSPDYTPSPTPIPRDTNQPTYSPLEKDDYKNYFFCGKTWVRRLNTSGCRISMRLFPNTSVSVSG